MRGSNLALGVGFLLASWLAASAARAELVLGVTYAVPTGTSSGSGQYYDDLSATKLTDGRVGTISGTNAYGVPSWDERDDNPSLRTGFLPYGHNVWVGWNRAAFSLDFDLHAQKDLTSIGLDYLGGQFQVSSVTATFSTDGVNFGGAVSSTAFDTSAPNGGCAPHHLTLDVSGNSARYVHLDFTSATTYGFLSEISFDAVAVPEPGTTVLLGSGAIGLCCFARRKRK